jgi:tetratricopeptide (TPR) repeat protein
MINARELEKRWLKYKTKGVILILSIFALLGLLVYGGYYILYKLDIGMGKNIQKQTQVLPIVKEIKEVNKTLTVKQESSSEVKNDSLMLSPTIPIIDLEKEKQKDKKIKIKRAIKYNIARKKKHIKKKKRLVKAKPETYLTPNELSVVNGSNLNRKKEKKKKIVIKGSSNNYMNIMKQKFERNKNPRDAILIAKAYYNAGNYKKAEEWALIANDLNNNLDESWMIFAKSKDKMGKRREALKILLTYYNRSKSSKVKALIEKMKSKSI